MVWIQSDLKLFDEELSEQIPTTAHPGYLRQCFINLTRVGAVVFVRSLRIQLARVIQSKRRARYI